MTTRQQFIDVSEIIISTFGEAIISFEKYEDEHSGSFKTVKTVEDVSKVLAEDWTDFEVHPHYGKHKKEFEKYRLRYSR